MTITSIQKVIKVGSSLAVTIPAKDAKYYNIQPGSEVKMAITLQPEKVKPIKSLEAEYQAFKAQYGQTLENLTDR